MKIIQYILLFLLSQCSCLTAQFMGKVIDEQKKPIQDVIILNLRTLTHTHTDALGKFLDKYSVAGDSIQFSYLGYNTLIIRIDESTPGPVEIVMAESSVLLYQVDVSTPLSQNLQRIDLYTNPVQNTQELLRKVPGLYIAQHAGGGKAEQMFLRGFDIDHGTDINVSVDHILPVNMPSHAHGQGYADLHFVIPETVANIDYDKGSYNAAKGNFATAGYVDFLLKDQLGNNSIIVETGKFQWNRIVGLFKLLEKPKNNSYIAAEYLSSDGYFENPQDFQKLNILFKHHYKINYNSGIKMTGSFFDSKWKASGQVPQRAINSGSIGRFGAIDPTEGGNTGRSNALIQYYSSSKAFQNFKISAYYSAYDFELYSNFTFFLQDSINGDQIRQKEKRDIYGLESNLENQFGNFHFTIAAGARIDDVHKSELSHTKNRIELIDRKSYGDINLQNYYSFLKLRWEKGRWDLQAQCRGDYFNTYYRDLLNPLKGPTRHSESAISPKLIVNYNVHKNVQFYFKSGIGFHSNDNRLLNSVDNVNILAKSLNSDFGVQLKLLRSLLLHTGIWYIDLEDELVYVGDEAVVESSGHTKRRGIEFGGRMQLWKSLFVEAEGSYTIAKSVEESEGHNFIPLASKWCSSGGIFVENIRNFSLGLRYRLLGDRPANEDYSIIAKGYTLLDGNINYTYRNMKFSIIAENLLNRDWNEAQFATLSRLKHETQAVEEIHFTPGTPFNLKFKMTVMF